jgi:hypothetical protein
MQNESAAGMARQPESECPEVASSDLTLLDRRHFLRGGALTIAGIAALSGLEMVRTPLALAQAGSLVSNLQLLASSSIPVPGSQTLQICRHFYQFDYQGVSILPDLVQTYRLNAGSIYPTAVPGGPAADRLQPLLQPAPFQSPALAPADPYPSLGTAPTGVPLVSQQLLPLVCYRLVQQIDVQTVRVFEWCSLYCFLGNFIVITVGDKCLCYFVGAGTAPPPPQKNVVNDSPQLVGYWEPRTSGSPNTSIGPGYFLTYNSQQGSFSTATWTSNLDVANGTQCKVEAHIPGTATPQARTARATYLVSNSGVVGQSQVTISQQVTTSQWVTLGVFPFRAGNFSVRLTDQTGEPTQSHVVVADAVRWTSP